MAETARKLRVRLTCRASNEWVALFGSLETFQKHLDGSVIWLYQEPVRLRIGEKWVEAGTQPALQNSEFRILLTNPDSDEAAWNYDVEKIIGAGKRIRAFDGEQVEVELLPSDIARKIEEVEEEVVAAAPTIRPIKLSPPARPARKCPSCGAEQEPDVIGLICACGAALPPELAREFEFAVVMFDDWQTLAEFHRKRLLAALSRATSGRKLSNQLSFDDRYITVLRAEDKEASSVADVNLLRQVMAELGDGTGKRVGEVLTDEYELRQIWKMLREKYPKSEIWRRNEAE